MKPRELIFDGVKSTDFGMIIAGDTVYNAPARRYNMVQIPGRNGDLAIDDESFENIPVTYPSAIHAEDQEEFAKRMRAIRNAILSKSGYRRLVDTYHPDEFRMGIYKSGLEVDPYHFNESGKFDLVFDCKPQRFLTSGEEEINVGEWGETEEASGEIATFEGKSNTGIKSLIAEINPIQNLNGYDAPWPGGARKNKLKVTATTQTVNGLTFTFRADGRIVINGTPTSPVTLMLNGSLGLPNGNYKYFAKGFPSTTVGGFYAENADGSRIVSAAHDSQSGLAINNSIQRVWLYFNTNQTFSNAIVELMITDSSISDPTFEPYENICPISGRDSVRVEKSGKNLAHISQEIIDNDRTVSGVTFHATSPSSVKITGTATASVFLTFGYSATSPYLRRLKKGTYTFSTNIKAHGLNGAYITGFPVSGGASQTLANRIHEGQKATFTINEDFLTNIQARFDSGYTANDDVWFMLEEGNAQSEYEPYQGETINKALGRTVYGGHLAFISGVLTVDRYIYQFSGDESSLAYTSGQLRRTGIAESYGDPSDSMICSHFKTDKRYGFANLPNQYALISGHTCAIRDDSITSLADWKTFLQAQATAGKPVQIVNELATPLTYQLTPEQIKAIKGINHVWSDSGKVTVIFGDDPNIMANPTAFQSEPLIIATGSGTITVGDVSIAVAGESGKDIYIDSEAMEAYSIEDGEIVSKNNKIALSGNDFPKLGEDTKVNFTGLSAVKVIPRWWTI